MQPPPLPPGEPPKRTIPRLPSAPPPPEGAVKEEDHLEFDRLRAKAHKNKHGSFARYALDFFLPTSMHSRGIEEGGVHDIFTVYALNSRAFEENLTETCA